jgi:GH25 family lysozyme M1 (1,4-beta-N-acetylmuramidase)
VPGSSWGGRSWTFWQYASDGTVPGISGRVDLDLYRFSSFDAVTY